MKNILLASFVLAAPITAQDCGRTAGPPPGFRCTLQPDGVLRFDRAAPGTATADFWRQFSALFQWKPTATLPFGRSVAFLVGVSRYQHLRPQLPFVETDVTELRNYLLSEAAFDTVFEIRNDLARRTLIEEYLVNKFSSDSPVLKHDDRLLIYYSGHGADRDGRTGYLQFAGARLANFAGDQVMPVLDFSQWAQSIVAKHLLIVLDACAAGLAVRAKGDVSPDELVQSLSGAGSGVLITAGTGDEKAWQIQTASGQGHSVFTRALLDGLREGQRKSDGAAFTTIHEALARAERQVGRFEARENKRMTPQVWPLNRRDGFARGTFVFLNRGRPPGPLGEPYATALAVDRKSGGPESIMVAQRSSQILLRATPKQLTKAEAMEMVATRNFFHTDWNPEGDGGKFVPRALGGEPMMIDAGNRLMWQQEHSSTTLSPAYAAAYIKALNDRKFAGFSDWRLPTLEECMTLLTKVGRPYKLSDGVHQLHLAAGFEGIGEMFTADYSSEKSWWVVNPFEDSAHQHVDVHSYARAVRAMDP